MWRRSLSSIPAAEIFWSVSLAAIECTRGGLRVGGSHRGVGSAAAGQSVRQHPLVLPRACSKNCLRVSGGRGRFLTPRGLAGVRAVVPVGGGGVGVAWGFQLRAGGGGTMRQGWGLDGAGGAGRRGSGDRRHTGDPAKVRHRSARCSPIRYCTVRCCGVLLRLCPLGGFCFP